MRDGQLQRLQPSGVRGRVQRPPVPVYESRRHHLQLEGARQCRLKKLRSCCSCCKSRSGARPATTSARLPPTTRCSTSARRRRAMSNESPEVVPWPDIGPCRPGWFSYPEIPENFRASIHPYMVEHREIGEWYHKDAYLAA